MMTTELVLLFAIYGFILFGVFMGENGPVGTYQKSAPRLAAHIEKNITIGRGFTQNDATVEWKD